MDYVIGCDIGSQSIQTLLISVEGKICGESSASYSIEYPQPTYCFENLGAIADWLKEYSALSSHDKPTGRCNWL